MARWRTLVRRGTRVYRRQSIGSRPAARRLNRFYNALLNNRWFGPAVLEWQQYRSIRYRTKLISIAMMAVTLGISIVFFVHDARVQAGLAVLGIALAVYMYRIPSRDHP